jgi:ketosteroid isomerase-like protein
MSESPVGLIERFYAAINEGVARGESVDEIVARVADWVDPQLEFVNPADAIEGGTRHGLDGLVVVAKNSREAGIHRWEVRDVTAEGDSVACRMRVHMVGASSGVETQRESSTLTTIRDGRITKLEWFFDPDEAHTRLAAAGP